MRAWPRCAPIPSFWKKPGDEGAIVGYRSDVGTCARLWLSANSVTVTGEGMVRSASAASAATRSPAVRGACWFWSGRYRPGIRCRNRSGRLSSRMPQPAGSSTGARSWPWSGQEIRWRQCRGCACYTYHSDARPNLLKLSESLAGTTRLFLCLKPGSPPNRQAVQNSSSGTIAFKCMGKKNACAHQAHHRCNRLDHRTNPLRPCNPQNDSTVAQSKRFTGRNRRSVVSDDLVQQIV